MKTAKETVLAYWEAMRSNDFSHAATWLSEDYVLDWPQSAERIIGRANFAAVNQAYPANGRWHFTLNAIVAESAQIVTDVSITDGSVKARAITFHTVENGLITKQVEFWPDDYPAPEWRHQWVESIGQQSGDSAPSLLYA